MWSKLSTLLLCLVLAMGCLAQTNSPAYTVQTLAGSAPAGDGGPADSAVLRFPNALAFDSTGVLYIADPGNASIRTVNPGGMISTIVGTGVSGFSGDGGPANLAQLGGTINGIALDNAGNLYISDSANHRIRVVTLEDGSINTVVTVSNLPGTPLASFWPNGLAIDNKGNLYIADDHNSQVYVRTPDGTVSVFAGIGKAGDSGDEGPANAAALVEPFGIFADNAGAVYIGDISANRIRKVSADGTIHAFAGTGKAGFSGDGGPAVEAQLAQPMHLVGDKFGNMYFADHSSNRNVRMIAVDGTISTVAGGLNPNGVIGGDGGPAILALIQQASGIAVSPSGDVYFSDSDASVRSVSRGMIATVAGYRHFAGENNPAAQALLAMPNGVAVDPMGNVFVADTNNFRVRQIGTMGIFTDEGRRRPRTAEMPNTIWTIAGTGQCGLTGDGGAAISAAMTRPLSLTMDSAQNLYVGFNGRVRVISPSGMIKTIAGGGDATVDGVPANTASLGRINGIGVSASGVIYFADTDKNVIRKITPDGIITTVAGNGVAGNSGDGSAAISAQLNGPTNLAIDGAGNLYIADTNNSRVRMIRADGTMTTFAGTGKVAEAGDNGPAVAAQLANPLGIAVDKAGTVYISDSASGMLRAVTSDGVIHSIGGAGSDPSNAGFAGDGGAALSAQFNGVNAITVDATGKIYLVDQQNERIRVLTPVIH